MPCPMVLKCLDGLPTCDHCKKEARRYLVCNKCGDEYWTLKEKSAWCEECIHEAEPIVSADYE